MQKKQTHLISYILANFLKYNDTIKEKKNHNKYEEILIKYLKDYFNFDIPLEDKDLILNYLAFLVSKSNSMSLMDIKIKMITEITNFKIFYEEKNKPGSD